VALGENFQTVSINGNMLVAGTGFFVPPGVTPGGIFSQITNMGRHTRNVFAVAPEAQLQLGYTTPIGIRFFVGYDFLYISDVMRPGNQIDGTINFTGNPAIAGPGAMLTGVARPLALLNGSSFWAQGINIGASYRF
jgi:hypothetical protein